MVCLVRFLFVSNRAYLPSASIASQKPRNVSTLPFGPRLASTIAG